MMTHPISPLLGGKSHEAIPTNHSEQPHPTNVVKKTDQQFSALSNTPQRYESQRELSAIHHKPCMYKSPETTSPELATVNSDTENLNPSRRGSKGNVAPPPESILPDSFVPNISSSGITITDDPNLPHQDSLFSRIMAEIKAGGRRRSLPVVSLSHNTDTSS